LDGLQRGGEAILSYAEIKAVATGNPLIKEKMQIDNDVQRLKMLKTSYDSQHYSLQDQFMVRFPKLIAAAKAKLSCVHADVKARDEQLLQPVETEFAITINGVKYTERVEGGTAMLKAASGIKMGTTGETGEYRGGGLPCWWKRTLWERTIWCFGERRSIRRIFPLPRWAAWSGWRTFLMGFRAI